MRGASGADAGAHEMDDVQINPCPSAPALPASPSCFPAPSDPAAHPEAKPRHPWGAHPSSRQSSFPPSFHPSSLPLDFSMGSSPAPASCGGTFGKPFPATSRGIWGSGRGNPASPWLCSRQGFLGREQPREHGRGGRSRVTSRGSLGAGWWPRVACQLVTCRKDTQGLIPVSLGVKALSVPSFLRPGRPGWDQPCPRPH